MLDCCIAKKLNRIMPECRYTMTANVKVLYTVRATATELRAEADSFN